MKFLVSSFILFSSVSSWALTLGEWTGHGKQIVTLKIGPKVSSYESECQVALNISNTPTQFGLPFAIFECGGRDSWNEHWEVRRAGNELFVGSERVGLISAKGVILSWKTRRTEEVTQNHYDSSCRFVSSKKEKLNLLKSTAWKLEFVSENHIEAQRETEAEAPLEIFVRPAHCRTAQTKTVVSRQTRMLQFSLDRKSGSL